MIFLKSLFYMIVVGLWWGAIGFGIGIPVFVVVGLLTWNSHTGGTASALCTFAGLIAGAINGFYSTIKEENEKREKVEREEQQKKRELEEASRRKKEQVRQAKIAHEREIENRKNQMARLLADAIDCHKSIPQLLLATNKHIDNAESEFKEGAFAPFWDEIENATNKIATYHKRIEFISRNAVYYEAESVKLSEPTPLFLLPANELPDARLTITRLQKIVRQAQKDYHFASIYEQRKTNMILVEGFGTLGSALYALGDVIASSLSDLSNNLHTSLDDLLYETRMQSNLINSHSEKHSALISEQIDRSEQRSVHQRKFEAETVEILQGQTKALDNIQRGRKPWP
jgi:hypothetical protein